MEGYMARKSVAAAAATGDRLKLLEALRNNVAELLDDPDTKAAEASSLTRQMLTLSEQIEAEKELRKKTKDKVSQAAKVPDEKISTPAKEELPDDDLI
jgi:hypothetical protein